MFQLVDNYRRTMEEEKKEAALETAPVKEQLVEKKEQPAEEKEQPAAEWKEQPVEEKKQPVEEKKQSPVISTIPEEVNTVDDIYDFSDISGMTGLGR